MVNEIIKYQPQNALVKKADNYLANLNALMPKKYAPDLPDLIPYRKGDLWGFCDRDKNIVIECKYDSASPFKEGLARIGLNGYGFIDEKGNLISDCIYDKAENFMEGLALVCVNKKYWFIDKNGKKITDGIFDSANNFSNGLAFVEVKGKYGYIDNAGYLITGLIYDDGYDFREGLAYVGVQDDSLKDWTWNKNHYAYIDKTGKQITDFIYRNNSGRNHFNDGFAQVREFEKWGFINISGEKIIKCIHEDVSEFNNGLAGFRLNSRKIYGYVDKWGFIDKTGMVIVKPIYKEVRDFSENFAAVMLEDKWGFIDVTGKVVLDFIYSKAYSFTEGLASVLLEGSDYCYINKFGHQVINGNYSDAGSFYNGTALIHQYSQSRAMYSDTYILIDKAGKQVYEFEENWKSDRKIAPNYTNIGGLIKVNTEYKNRHYVNFIDKFGNQYWEEIQ